MFVLVNTAMERFFLSYEQDLAYVARGVSQCLMCEILLWSCCLFTYMDGDLTIRNCVMWTRVFL